MIFANAVNIEMFDEPEMLDLKNKTLDEQYFEIKELILTRSNLNSSEKAEYYVILNKVRDKMLIESRNLKKDIEDIEKINNFNKNSFEYTSKKKRLEQIDSELIFINNTLIQIKHDPDFKSLDKPENKKISKRDKYLFVLITISCTILFAICIMVWRRIRK